MRFQKIIAKLDKLFRMTEEESKRLQKSLDEHALENHGRIYVHENTVNWEYKGKLVSKTEINKVRVIGEYITLWRKYTPVSEIMINGKLSDRYGWYLVLISDDQWSVIDLNAYGMDEVMDSLSEHFKDLIKPSLYPIVYTGFKTKILWPASSTNKKLSHFIPITPRLTFLEILNIILNGGNSLEIVLNKKSIFQTQ